MARRNMSPKKCPMPSLEPDYRSKVFEEVATGYTYEMAVEVGAIHAGELGLAADGQPTTAAHAGAVDHDGVHRDHGLQAILFGQHAHELHHDDRADGDDFVVLVALFDEFLQGVGDQALSAVTAVVGHHAHL